MRSYPVGTLYKALTNVLRSMSLGASIQAVSERIIVSSERYGTWSQREDMSRILSPVTCL